MKKVLLSVLLAASLYACKNTETKEATAASETPAPATVEHIYKPTYTDNFKIGDPKNVLLVEKFHKAMFEKKFDEVGTFLADTAMSNMEDGSTIKGKKELMDYISKNFSQINIKNYQVSVSIPVVGENGHEWVLMWDSGDVETPDGKTQKIQWQDAIHIENGRIVQFVGFARSPKP